MDASNTTIKVTTEILSAKANDAAERINILERCLEDIRSTVENTKGYWIGEAGEKCRQQYEKQQDMVSEVLKRLKKQPQTLLSIAGVYSNTENTAREVSMILPGDALD